MKILFAIAMLLVATPVSAQNNFGIDGGNIKERAQEVKETLNERTGQYREQLNLENDGEESKIRLENRELRRVRLGEQHTERVRNSIGKIGDKFNIVIERFEDIIDRFESRLDKFDEQGVDNSETRDLLLLATDNVNNLKEIISNSQSSLEKLISEEVSIDDIRSTIDTVRDSVNLTRDSIVDALNNFKASIEVDTTPSDDDNE